MIVLSKGASELAICKFYCQSLGDKQNIIVCKHFYKKCVSEAFIKYLLLYPQSSGSY